MSGAEMTIRLVDGTEAEQAAFNRGPDDHEPNNGVPSVGGVESPNSQRSDTVEAIAAGFANITDKEAKEDSQHDTTATVAAMHEQFAAIATSKQDDKPNHQQGDPSDKKNDGPTTEDYRGFRVSLEQLVQRFTPKFFSEPMDRLIAALRPTDSKPANRETKTGTELPAQMTGDKTPIIPAVGHVAPKQDEGEKTGVNVDGKQSQNVPAVGHPSAEGKPATIPVVGHVDPKRDEGDDKENEKQTVLKKLLTKYKIVRAVNAVKSVAKKFNGRFQSAAKSFKSTLEKTKTGRSFLSRGSKLATKFKGSSAGKAVARAGRSIIAAVGRSAGGAASSGAAGGTGTTVAAGGASVAGEGAGAAAMGAAGAAGLAVGGVTIALVALAIAVKKLNEEFVEQTDLLEPYSAKIAIARGNKQINTELNMMDRAKKIDGPLASLETSKADLNSQMEKLWTEILTVLVRLSPLLEMGVNGLSVVTAATREQVATVESLSAMIQTFVATLTPGKADDTAAQNATNAAARSLADAQKDLTDALNRLAGNQGNAGMQGDPMLLSLLNARF